MISPRSQESQFVPLSLHNHMPFMNWNQQGHYSTGDSQPASSNIQSQMVFLQQQQQQQNPQQFEQQQHQAYQQQQYQQHHQPQHLQQPSSATSSVSSTLSQVPYPSHPGLQNSNYTTSSLTGQVPAGSVSSFSHPYVQAPQPTAQGLTPFFYEQNSMGPSAQFPYPQSQSQLQQHQPGHLQLQGGAQPMYYPATSFPLMTQPTQSGSNDQYFPLVQHADGNASSTSLPALGQTGSLSHSHQHSLQPPPQQQQQQHSQPQPQPQSQTEALANDQKPFPGVLDTHYHNSTGATSHQRSATFPTDTSSHKPSKKRSSSSSSTGGGLGMTEETARRNRCSICQKQFKRPSSLQTHLYSHTGEKPFQCSWATCGRLFSVRSNMIRHRKLHERDASLVDDKPEQTEEQVMLPVVGEQQQQQQQQQEEQPLPQVYQLNQSAANNNKMMPPQSWPH